MHPCSNGGIDKRGSIGYVFRVSRSEVRSDRSQQKETQPWPIGAAAPRRKRRPRVELLEARALLSSLSTSLTTNQSVYQPGQPIQMTFTETNTINQPVTIGEGPSIDGFDVTQNGKPVWESNAGVNPLFILVKTLQPGQSLTLIPHGTVYRARRSRPSRRAAPSPSPTSSTPRERRRRFKSSHRSHPA